MDITDFPKDVATAFFKCTRWLVEETRDESTCAYCYSCDSPYPVDDYALVVDILVVLFAISVYASSAYFLLVGATNVANTTRRYLLPSGPVALPTILFVLARGSRINTLFPISVTGPAVLHLLHISALSFRYDLSDRSVKYAVLEASTVSGVLHASLYLDSVVVPYYTGLDALGRSAFSGECMTCVCRAEALAVGGTVSYRAWSRTTAAVVGTLCLRMLSRALGEERSRLSVGLEKVAEGFSWVLIAADVVYVAAVVPRGGNGVVTAASYGGVLGLILITVLRKVSGFLARIVRNDQYQKNVYLCKSNVELP